MGLCCKGGDGVHCVNRKEQIVMTGRESVSFFFLLQDSEKEGGRVPAGKRYLTLF